MEINNVAASVSALHVVEGDSAIAEDESTNLAITNVEAVTSYNWLDRKKPTIAVPGKLVPLLTLSRRRLTSIGMPAQWLNRVQFQPLLKPDSESRYLDQNAAKYGQSPFEPGIKAVLHQNSDYDFTTLDLITDRYALASLLEFANGKQKAFSFGAQVIGHTIVCVRDDAEPRQDITKFRGYRVDFVTKYLEYPTAFENSLKHYRIITYQLGELKVMLRYAADGYLPDLAGELPDTAYDQGDVVEGDGSLAIVSTGVLVPHDTIIELNTCRKRSEEEGPDDHITAKFREAWLSQAHHFVHAESTMGKRYRKMKDFRQRFGE